MQVLEVLSHFLVSTQHCTALELISVYIPETHSMQVVASDPAKQSIYFFGAQASPAFAFQVPWKQHSEASVIT